MVSDSDLVNRLREILQTSDLNTTSAGAVRRQLQADFGVDLTDRKKFISQQIDKILQAGEINGAEDENATPPTTEEDDAAAAADEEIEVEEEEEEESDDERSKEEETKKKRKETGFTKLCSLSPQLQELVGVPEMGRTEVVKKLWAYIKEKDLQDPKNRRNIKCDEMLHSIFRVDTINMFQMNKSLTKHIWPLESEEDRSTDSPAPAKKQKGQKDEDRSTDSPAPAKKQKRQKDEDTEKSNENTKQKKGNATGFLKPLQLSDAFAKFLGTGETTIVRSDAVKRIWDYIKQNQLQDPSDKRRILCDEKLKELFDVDTFTGFTVSKLLAAHLTKIEC